ncbi:MAG: hypothetical protein FWB73_02760 [Treponema sp.]|nr:hypothetical protein [Treponema sp.]
MAIGQFLWKISVALYLIVNGYFGIVKDRSGDFYIILTKFFGNNAGIFIVIAGIIALVAGICIILNMLKISNISFLPTLVLIVAIIWAVYVVVGIIYWIGGGFGWDGLQRLAIHLMVLASLLIASGRFGD